MQHLKVSVFIELLFGISQHFLVFLVLMFELPSLCSTLYNFVKIVFWFCALFGIYYVVRRLLKAVYKIYHDFSNMV